MVDGDTNRKLVARLGQYGAIYHVINEGGVPYTIIEDMRNGMEIASTPTENEEEMINYYITDSPFILSDLEEEHELKKAIRRREELESIENQVNGWEIYK